MSEAGDNREGTRRPFTRRPDGSWPLQDARERREQRDTTPPPAATTTTGEPGEDHQLAYALGLADSMLTSDGTPCTDQLTPEQDEVETGAVLPTLGEPERDQPTAQEIIRTLADDQQATARARRAVADSQPGPSSGPPRPTPTASHRGASRWRVRPLTAAITTVVAAVIVVAIAFRSASPPDRHAAHIPAAAATTAATHLSASAATMILELARNTDHNDAARSVRDGHAPRARRAPNRAAERHPSSQHAVSATPTIDTATTPTGTVPAPSAGSGSDQSSTSSTSGYHPTPAVTAPTATQPTTASHSTTSPSKATLRSLINGAGRCGC